MSTSLYAMPKNLVLAASAGTGKTFALVGVVVHAFVRGSGEKHEPIDPARVVATTFSRKAAAEIRERVTLELERLAAAPATSPYAAALRGDMGAGDVLDDAVIARRARHALGRLPAARFGTLHGFATSIVRAYAVELGLGPGFDLATEADANARSEDAIARALEKRFATSPDAVRALAEAAGGIDRLVVQLRRTLGRLEEDGRAARDLVIPEGDARAVEAQLDVLLGHARDLVLAPKFEVAAREVLAAHGAGDEAQVEEAVAALFDIDARGKKSPEVEAFSVYRRELPGSRNEVRGRNLVRAWRARARFAELGTLARDVLAEAEEEIRRQSRARAQLGFGEILRAARELLLERPDVAEEVSLGLDALLVDEFQDTSRVQRDLLQLLWAVPGARAKGAVPALERMRGTGLLVVGDRKQSIYGFRGADVGVFAELAVGLAGAPARAALGIPIGVTWEPERPLADFHALRHNRRSIEPVLAFANAFSARRFRPGAPPELYEIEYVRETEDLLVPPERAREAGSADAALPARTTWLRVAPKGNSSSRLEEALVIAERIKRILATGSPTVGKEERPPAYRDLAVLATSNAMLDAVAFALAQADVPYVVAGKSFFRTREVRDLAAMLAFVLDPSDRLAMLEVLRGPWGGLHDESLLALTAPGGGLVPIAQWRTPPQAELLHAEDRASLEGLEELVTALSRAAGRLGPGTILREAVRARALEDVLSLLPRGEQRVANVRKLLAIADRHEDARAFRAWLDQATEQELAESEAATFSEEDDAVRLLTVHASKGLDFPIVFVPEVGAAPARTDKGALRIDLGAGDEPNRLCVRVVDAGGTILEPPSYAAAYATAKRRERAERQRLAYVAVTRAADAMFLVGGRSRDTALDPGASTLAVLEDLASSEASLAEACLAVEDVTVPAPTPQRALAEGDAEDEEAPAPVAPPRLRPKWRSLPIAPTALADFDHCARRFELVHLLGFPEHQRVRAETPSRAATALDARAQGTLAHAVLERVPLAAFGAGDAAEHASRALAAEGIGPERPEHDAIVQRVTKFLRGAYATELAAAGAQIAREVPFVLPVADEEGREVVLRGNMDLVVTWPDGSVDVVDYKSARSGETAPYAFQLDVYALAARLGHDVVPRLRAGLVFLGGAAGAPVWRELPSEDGIRARLAKLGDRLVEARWSERFPRVPLARCETITCGFIGRCHADLGASGGTDAKPPRDTTT